MKILILGFLLSFTLMSWSENGQIPFQVSLQQIGVAERSGHICGGSLLDEYTVLTAAHCFDNSSSHRDFRIVAGANILNGPPEKEQRRMIRQIFKYSDRKNLGGVVYLNDLAVVIVEKPFHLHKSKYAKLPENGDYPKGNVQVSGWGDTHEYNVWTWTALSIIVGLGVGALCLKLSGFDSVFSIFAVVIVCVYLGGVTYSPVETLQVADLPLLSQEECEKKILERTPLAKGDWVNTLICTEPPAGNAGPLKGDPGGPLAQNGVVLGIVSKDDDRIPVAVYTRVSDFRDWIVRKIELMKFHRNRTKT